MEVLVRDIAEELENLAPREYAESYDNIGLIVGSYFQKVKKILITLDLTEEVFSESIHKNCNLIISFHPVIFKSIKSLTGNTFSERVVISALKNDISIYVIHTNLDVSWEGTHSYISKLLQLNREKSLFPKNGTIKKLTTYVPISYSDKVRNSLFNAGAGKISNYSRCSYNFDGFGSFMGNEKSKPFFGKKEHFHMEKETCINVVFSSHKLNLIKEALFKSHPYEEVPYEIYNIENINPYIGIGIIGFLIEEMNEYDFLLYLRNRMNLLCIRHSILIGKKIKKIAMIAGSGSFGIEKAIKEKAHVFISSDFKYHDFFKSEKKILIVDIGHYESEKFNKNLLKSFLDKKFTHIPVYESEIHTNPVKYFY
ncbi:Nif3-like dinuclear metal center hexameric protein [Blattabacterium punctulatus]|uniref:Nif3-like dinuclear metal center hexameric protein n=1 Tax=Blattabacterium punctulatus TaxID=164514 RepID=UPI000D7CB050|nr:Nif3-like dinuclear metal center hexameric protein [Blattabacterium punctulatus]AWU43309.1 Nif3-like dinuclear metal center hexameric protein [Blattabacterium punctulatus]